jgi:hypothetical protein
VPLTIYPWIDHIQSYIQCKDNISHIDHIQCKDNISHIDHSIPPEIHLQTTSGLQEKVTITKPLLTMQKRVQIQIHRFAQDAIQGNTGATTAVPAATLIFSGMTDLYRNPSQ